jgi:PPOX class probable F420-dependent enzyme
MAKQRDAIRMTEIEQREFLEQGRSLQLATLGKDGFPHLVTMWYGLDEQGRILLETYGRSQKMLNLRRDPRLSVLVEAGHEYDELRGVSIQGRAQLVDDFPSVLEIMRRVLARNHAGLGGDMLERAAESGARKRHGIIIHPLRTISWDHRKIAKGR